MRSRLISGLTLLCFAIVLPMLAHAPAAAQDQLQLPGEVSQWFVNTDGSCVQCSNSNCGVWHNLPQESTLLFNTQQYGRPNAAAAGPAASRLTAIAAGSRSIT
jgi:hypothetical protein